MSTNEKAGQTPAYQVPAGAAGTIEVATDGPCTLEHLKLRIYDGAENTLQLRPQKERNGTYDELLAYGDGKQYVDGDDDVWEWDLSIPFETDEKIVIRYDNTDTQNPHNFRATTSVDYMNGAERAAHVLKQWFGGVV